MRNADTSGGSDRNCAPSRDCVSPTLRRASAESTTFWGSRLSWSPPTQLPSTGTGLVNQNGVTVSGFGTVRRYCVLAVHESESAIRLDGLAPASDDDAYDAVIPSSVYRNHGDSLPVLDTWTRTFRDDVVVRARSRTRSASTSGSSPPTSAPARAASARSSSRTSPLSGS